MFAEQRMEIIKQILREQKHVNIATLSSTLKVSDVTVRKYLDILEKQGVLEKVHGGAIWGPEGHECEPFSEPDEDENLDAIAALAATLVEEGDSLYV
ncbi:MAG: DeoR family transcriptional regulator, partial [Clostridia bacterium]